MKIICGAEEAGKMLTRQINSDAIELPLGIRASLNKLFGTENASEAVIKIVSEVRSNGDNALLSLTHKIDGIELKQVEVLQEEIAASVFTLDSELLTALKFAASQVRDFHSNQMKALLAGSKKIKPGTLMRPIERVGIYVPGGTASYPSSVLMIAIPAKVAGVREIIMTTPPGKDGHVPAMTLAAAYLAGVDRVFVAGGAQAISAMAYGTESVPKVDKICGPGNVFVMLAKKLVYGAVDIDGLQGPSEVLIIADETANAAYCAADMLAQAEHDPLSQSILLTTSPELARETQAQIEIQLKQLERQTIIRGSIDKQGIIAVVNDIMQAIDLANLYAPEHLCLMILDAQKYVENIKNAGCVFTGYRPTVVLGDYVAGPSHALPTSGTARFSSPLNVTDFVKFINVVSIRPEMLSRLGTTAVTLAKAEGLTAHAHAMQLRLEQ